MEKFNDKCEVFNWQEYLDLCKATDVPYILFKHVEQSLDTGFSCGMVVEAPSKSNETTSYWPAKITKICGPMITLKYIGSDENDKSSEIWSDINSLRYIGFSASQNLELIPPICLNSVSSCSNKEEFLKELLKNIPVVPKCVLEEGGKNAVDRITNGMIVGVRDALDPYLVEKAEIALHIGGRLFLKIGNNSENTRWIFYTDYRIVAIDDCNNSVQFPHDLLMKHPKIEEHSFELGMQVEMLNPKTKSTLHNGIVSKVIDKYFFIVSLVNKCGEFDKDITTENSWLCTLDHPYIFPNGWASKNNLQIIQSNDIDTETCTYKEMFSIKHNASTLGFEIGMKLEAVHPRNPNAICVATIKSIHEHLLCITFDHEVQNNLTKFYYVDYNSNEIFPIYWCGTNNYELIHPKTELNENAISIDENSCPVIYFNYKCRTGPMHSHKKISQLPKSVGPGEVSQVLKKVLNLIVSEAYQPLRILRLLECEDSPGPGRTLVELKASNYNSMKAKVTVRANVDVVTQAKDVEEYCREVCKTIQACPYLFGPHDIGENCPENCAGDKNGNGNDKTNKTKTVKCKRRKRKGLHFKTIQAQARRTANQSDQNNDSDSDSVHTSEPVSRPGSPMSTVSNENENTSNCNVESLDHNEQTNDNLEKSKGKKRRKRKHVTHSPPPQVYEMKTRGAKLPNFALQIKQGHWDKKDVETLYKKTYSNSSIPKKKPRYEYITESDSDTSGSMDNKDNANLNLIDSNMIKEESFELEKETFNIKLEKQCENEDDLNMKTINVKEEIFDIIKSEEDVIKNEEDLNRNSIDKKQEDISFHSNAHIKLKKELKVKRFDKLPQPHQKNVDLKIDSNPLHWSVDKLYDFLTKTDCCDLAETLKDELIDGQAFMMLNLPFVRKYLNLRLDAAMKLCEHVARIKLAFFIMYGN